MKNLLNYQRFFEEKSSSDEKGSERKSKVQKMEDWKKKFVKTMKEDGLYDATLEPPQVHED